MYNPLKTVDVNKENPIIKTEITIKPSDIEKIYDRELINQENVDYEVVEGKGEIYTRDLGKLTIDIIFKDSMGEVTPINAGEYIDHPYQELEKRCGDLYGLFAADTPDPPASEENRRVIYVRT